MWLRIGILTFGLFGPVLFSMRAQVTNPRPVRSTVLMLPSTYAGETFNAVNFDPRADGILYLWPRTATEGGGTGGTNVAGITNLNGITNANQTFAAGTAGTDFAISSSGSTHTFDLPTASSSKRGALSSGDWSTFNNKQGAITVQTNGVTLATIPTTWNFGPGLTGYVSGSTVVLGNSVAGGGDVTTAQLLGVSNQVQVASNKFETDTAPWTALTTNKVVTTNDAWLDRVASNRVEVAAGAGVSVASANSGNKQVFTVTATAGAPGGDTGDLQYNNGAGGFAGNDDLTWDSSNRRFQIVGATTLPLMFLNYSNAASGITNQFRGDGLTVGGVSTRSYYIRVGETVSGGTPHGGVSVETNAFRPIYSNHVDNGTVTLPWRTNFSHVVVARDAIRLGDTNGGSGLIFSNAGLWRPTNVIVLNITNPTVGQVLKIARVDNLSGGTVVIGVTNDTDSTGGGGGGGGAGSLPMNPNQFDTNGVASIENGARLTNVIVHEFLRFTNASSPGIPETNHLYVGKDSYAGRGFLESWDDNGLSIAYQPFLGNNRVQMILPGTTATTLAGYGMVTPVTLGGVTVSHPPPTEEWPLMVQLATPATSNACAGVFSSADMTTMGTRYGHNGYFLATEFMTTNLLNQHTKTAPAGNRLFIGRTSTASPNLTNIVNTTNGTGQYAGLYVDSGYTNEFFLTARDGTAEFRTNTGMLWVATNLYQFYMMQAPTSRMLAWTLKDLTSNTVSRGWFSNNVPTNMMKFGYLIRNGTTVVNSVRFNKMYVEAPLSP